MSLYEPVLMESGQPGSKHRAGPLNPVSIKTNIKMQYEIVLKVIGGVHVILAFLKLFLLLKLLRRWWLLRVLVLL